MSVSLEEDRALLEAVRNWKPSGKLHPIAMFTWRLYEEAGNTMGPEQLGELKLVLDEYQNREDLVGMAEAFEGLLRFCIYIGRDLGDEDNKEKVAALMREYMHLFEPFWERVGEALSNVGEEARGEFSKFLGIELSEDKKAPGVEQKAPEGTIPLKRIAPPPRPPPFTKVEKK